MIDGSALRKLSAITGLNVTRDKAGSYVLWITDTEAMVSMLDDEKSACEVLRRDNLRRVSQAVFESQGWRCAGCGSVKPLQGHHKIFRSRWRRQDGPLDVASNLVGLCAACHEKPHGR